MCIRELFREFVAARRRAIEEADMRVVLAWQTAALCIAAFNGKLPKLEAVLTKGRSRQQRPEDQRNVLHMLSARYGIPLRKTRLIRKEPKE